MRLQLTRLVIVLLALRSLAASAQSTVTWKNSAYTDDDNTVVVTELFDGLVRVHPRVEVGAHVLLDGISSASVDVVSAATKGFNETRVETGARATLRAPRDATLAVALVRSEEKDWLAHGLQLTLAKDLAQKNTRVEIGYGFSGNRVGRAMDPTFHRSLDVSTIEAGATQLLDQKTLVGLTVTLQIAEGCMQSPYRFVTTAGGQSFPETHPETRLRDAVTLRALRYVAGAGVDLAYRLYLDDWGIMSHTVSASVGWAFGDRWDLRVRARAYRQGAASFWHERYAVRMKYMSADRELSTFWDAGGGLKLALRLGRWIVDAKSDVVYYRFEDFAPLAGRTAVVSDLGVGYTW